MVPRGPCRRHGEAHCPARQAEGSSEGAAHTQLRPSKSETPQSPECRRAARRARKRARERAWRSGLKSLLRLCWLAAQASLPAAGARCAPETAALSSGPPPPQRPERSGAARGCPRTRPCAPARRRGGRGERSGGRAPARPEPDGGSPGLSPGKEAALPAAGGRRGERAGHRQRGSPGGGGALSPGRLQQLLRPGPEGAKAEKENEMRGKRGQLL